MDFRSIINRVCGIAGICIIIFGILVKAGIIGQVEPERGMVPIILGAVIVLWSWYSQHRR